MQAGLKTPYVAHAADHMRHADELRRGAVPTSTKNGGRLVIYSPDSLTSSEIAE
jgi:hypothetical protein